MTDPQLIRKTILMTLEEKLEAINKKIQELEGQAVVRQYKELLAGRQTLIDAMNSVKAESLPRPPRPQPEQPSLRLSRRMRAIQVHRTGGQLLFKGKTLVYQAPYSRMLQEFRGERNVTPKRIRKFLAKEFGFSEHGTGVSKGYIRYAIQQGTVKAGMTNKAGRILTYDFPSQYGAVPEAEQTEEPWEELRKGGLVP